MKTISSQRYLDPSIVAAKRAARDYVASAVVVELDGEAFAVVIDGHHSIAAAKADGVSFELEIETTSETAREARDDAASFMAAQQLDSEWYDISTGRDVW